MCRLWSGFVLGIFIVCLKTVSSLKCFSCSNLVDDRCGVTWGYSDKQADNYLEQCEGQTVLCRKLEYELFPHGEKVVTRSCWNTTSVWIPPDTVCRDMFRARVCYCANGDEPCNGTQLRQFSVILCILAGFISLASWISFA